jgi:hypothetical protein
MDEVIKIGQDTQIIHVLPNGSLSIELIVVDDIGVEVESV